MGYRVDKRGSWKSTYFHQDFHIALNYGIEYLLQRFGIETVQAYLAQFAKAYYAPLKRALKETGLVAVKAHYEKIYEIEGAQYHIKIAQDELLIHLLASPAVNHIQASGHQVSPLFHETIGTVNKEICRDTPFNCEMTSYDPGTGGYQLRYYKRHP